MIKEQNCHTLAFVPGPSPLQLPSPLENIVHYAIARYVLQSILLADIATAFTHHHAKLYLSIGFQ